MEALRKMMAILLVITLAALPVFAKGASAETATAQPTTVSKNPLFSYHSPDSKDRLEVLDFEKQQQDTYYLGITLSFSYQNPRDPMECACFSDKYTLAVFQKNVSCSQVYVTGYYSKPNADTLVRNGASVTFSMGFALAEENEPFEIVIIPVNARSSKDYIVVQGTLPTSE